MALPNVGYVRVSTQEIVDANPSSLVKSQKLSQATAVLRQGHHDAGTDPYIGFPFACSPAPVFSLVPQRSLEVQS